MRHFLTYKKRKLSGRNRQNKIIIYARGGETKKIYYYLDYLKYIWNIPGKFYKYEYLYKSYYLSLVIYYNGIICYMPYNQLLKINDTIITKDTHKFLNYGYTTYLKNIKNGTFIYNIELYVLKGAKYIRTPGSFAKIISQKLWHTVVKINKAQFLLYLNLFCLVCIGKLYLKKYKTYLAGHLRYKGIRPKTRIVAKNACDNKVRIYKFKKTKKKK